MSFIPRNTGENNKKQINFYALLKNIFMVFLLLQFTPFIIQSVKKIFQDYTEPKTLIGHLRISGMITDSMSFIKRIEKFRENDDIKAVLLRIDSPGGLPAAAQAMFNELNKLKEKKPVVVLTENICASAAYYISAAAHKIIVAPSSMVGSIGVVMQLPMVKKFLNNWSVNVKQVQSGDYKTIGSPFEEMTLQGEDYLQQLTDNAYKRFVKDIAQARGLDEQNAEVWANGKIFTGEQAIELNLADEEGSFSDAIAAIKELAKIEGDVRLVTLRKGPSGLMKILMGDDDEQTEDIIGSSSQQYASFFGSVLAYAYKNIIESGYSSPILTS